MAPILLRNRLPMAIVLVMSPFLKLMRAVLSELQEEFDHPIDIEFACDGTDFYLLQCRSQSYREENIPAVIPTNIPEDKLIFTANRYISNGTISNITHIVHVAPEKYNQLSNRQEMLAVGQAIGRLNQILPRKQQQIL